MRIKNIKIVNYRSIKDLSLDCNPLTVFLGPNNHGKSNILYALNFALTGSAKLSEDDFCAYSNTDEAFVELTFCDLTEQEKNTFRRYTTRSKEFSFRKTSKKQHDGSIETSYNGYIDEPEQDWLKNNAIDDLTTRDAINKTPLKDLVPEKGRITKKAVEEAQLKFIKENVNSLTFKRVLEKGPLLGQKNVSSGILPDFYLVPAVRDLAEETKIKGTSIFGRLITRAVTEMAALNPQFTKIKKELDNLINIFNLEDDSAGVRPQQLATLEQNVAKELSQWDVKVRIEILPPEVEKIFELGTNLYLDDGIKTLAEKKGHGLQRALIFALLKSWANTIRQSKQDSDSLSPRKASESLFFAIEEPELFLHPHAQQKLKDALSELSTVKEHQVFLCSHSTHFLDLNDYKSIVLVSKPNNTIGTTIHQCTADLFEGETNREIKNRFHMAHWINPDRGEMFFARKIVFVEGETEKTLFPFLAQKIGIFDRDISFIDTGSKFNLPLYAAIANAFHLNYIIIHDEDSLPDPIPTDWNPDKLREKTRTFQFNAKIAASIDSSYGTVEILSRDFEDVAQVSRNQGQKKGKAIAALEHFANVGIDSIPDRLKEVLRIIFQG